MSNKPRNTTSVQVSWLDCMGGFEDAKPIGTGDLSHVPRELEHVELHRMVFEDAGLLAIACSSRWRLA